MSSNVGSRRSTAVSLTYLIVIIMLWSAAMSGGDARPSAYGYSVHDRLLDALRSRRNHHVQCVSASGTCFTSGQCCNGLVCASFDDYFGLKPEVPGYCVREKDLQPCQDGSDCETGTRCMALGRSSELYCLPAAQDLLLSAPVQPKLPLAVAANTVGGGLGSSCQTNDDCAPYAADETTRLCCQDVRRGRQGIRRQCDRYNERISACIPSVAPGVRTL
jgi:hypothetical protein